MSNELTVAEILVYARRMQQAEMERAWTAEGKNRQRSADYCRGRADSWDNLINMIEAAT